MLESIVTVIAIVFLLSACVTAGMCKLCQQRRKPFGTHDTAG